MNLGGYARIPVFSGTNAQRLASTTMLGGDIWTTTDTANSYSYDGASWVLLNTPPAVSSCTRIETKAGTGASGTVTFSGIATGYKSFILDYSTSTSGDAEGKLNLNNDSGADTYKYNYIVLGNTGTVYSGKTSGTYIRLTSNQNNSGNAPIMGTIHILNDTQNYKYISANTFTKVGGGAPEQSNFISGQYISTTEISRIDISISTGNFGTDSIFTLWGLS